MTPYQPTCPSCMYWDNTDSQEAPIGRCRRYAPRPTSIIFAQDEEGDSAVWPYTEETEWCGEHHPAPRVTRPE